jgi:hypothetical protein
MNRLGYPRPLLVAAFGLAFGLLACDGPGWGPLAVVPTTGDDARIEGRLQITEQCVFIEVPTGERNLLVWPADRTAWDPTGTISFRRGGDDVVSLRSGQTVAFGGGGSNRDRDGQVNWVAPPASSCPMDGRWYVSAVEFAR